MEGERTGVILLETFMNTKRKTERETDTHSNYEQKMTERKKEQNCLPDLLYINRKGDAERESQQEEFRQRMRSVPDL